MSWNIRIVRDKTPDGTEYYSAREVFYNPDGSIYAYTLEPIDVSDDNLEDLQEYVHHILRAFGKDILNAWELPK